MNKSERPHFFVIYKDFNGEMKSYDVLEVIFDYIFTTNGVINTKEFYIYNENWEKIPVQTKEQLHQFIEDKFRYHFWAKCEWEFVAIDWPYRNSIKESHPVKIDVYDQLEPNIPIITDIVWNYINQINK